MSGKEKNKLSQEQVNNLIEDFLLGKRKCDIAKKYGIDHSTIYYYLEKYKIKAKTKLTQEIKNAIIEDFKNKTQTHQSIADKYNVKLSTIEYYYRRGIRRNDTKAKNYSDFLKIENDKRKASGLYTFKNGLAKEKAFGYNYK